MLATFLTVDDIAWLDISSPRDRLSSPSRAAIVRAG
jgi:hypothetical protein